MGVNSLPKTVTRQRRDCDLNPGPSAPESSTLTTRLPSHPLCHVLMNKADQQQYYGQFYSSPILEKTIKPQLITTESYEASL